ncbi:hypothetical protein ACM0CQ_11945 [Mycobacteroides abscessus subsp. abscessus]|uniref:hypothetical protein n=1 Tax=Mycobacteroides abscessus TaxID=36809 RepID=UPI0039EE7480
MSALIIVAAVTGLIVWLVTKDRPQQNAAAALRWAQLHQYATQNQMQLLYIENDYQHARQGSKAVVHVYGNPTVKRDAWFWWEQVYRGSVVAVRHSQGWGPHNHRDDVLYVGDGPNGRSGIYGTLDAKTLIGARRHYASSAMANRSVTGHP